MTLSLSHSGPAFGENPAECDNCANLAQGISVGRFFDEIGGDPEHGPEQVAVILQSALMLDNALVEASLVAQVKAPNPV